jgi:hypothetical protein
MFLKELYFQGTDDVTEIQSASMDLSGQDTIDMFESAVGDVDFASFDGGRRVKVGKITGNGVVVHWEVILKCNAN